jgi:hypothetical protein
MWSARCRRSRSGLRRQGERGTGLKVAELAAACNQRRHGDDEALRASASRPCPNGLGCIRVADLHQYTIQAPYVVGRLMKNNPEVSQPWTTFMNSNRKNAKLLKQVELCISNFVMVLSFSHMHTCSKGASVNSKSALLLQDIHPNLPSCCKTASIAAKKPDTRNWHPAWQAYSRILGGAECLQICLNPAHQELSSCLANGFVHGASNTDHTVTRNRHPAWPERFEIWSQSRVAIGLPPSSRPWEGIEPCKEGIKEGRLIFLCERKISRRGAAK